MRSELPSLITIAAMLAASAIAWRYLPAVVAVHFALDGRPDDYGSPFVVLLVLPLIATLVWANLRFVLPRVDPLRRNYARFAPTYDRQRHMIVLFVALLHAVLLVAAFRERIETNLVLAALGLLLVGLGNSFGKLRPNWFLGIRTPWTLSSESVWMKTHRVGGRLFVAAGLLVVAGAFIVPGARALGGAAATIVAIALFLVAYSYVVWRREQANA